MGFYKDRVVSTTHQFRDAQRDFAAYRSRVVPAASGRVLEIGIGAIDRTCGLIEALDPPHRRLHTWIKVLNTNACPRETCLSQGGDVRLCDIPIKAKLLAKGYMNIDRNRLV